VDEMNRPARRDAFHDAVRAACRLPIVALLAAVTAATGSSRGEDDRVVEEAAAVEAQPEQQHLIDLGSNFDANLFEQQGNGWVLRGDNGGLQIQAQAQLIINGRRIVNGRQVPIAGDEERPPESPAFARARAIAEKRLARIDDACSLTDAQRRTLRLAIESDIRRFAVEVDEIRGAYAGVRVNLNDQEGQKTWHRFQQDVQQCRQRLHGLFDSGSLFSKVLPSTLDERQVAGIAAERRDRRSFRWRAMVVSVVLKLDDMLGLTQKQHDVIEAALLAKEPALRIDELAAGQENGHLQQNLVYMVLAGADTAAVKAVTSERQWQTLSLLMNQGKSMRSWIEQQGILEAPPP
jgi:hypothetical protein